MWKRAFVAVCQQKALSTMLNKKVKEISMYRLFILFWAFMLSTVSFAQADLKVRSMTLTTSHIPAADKRNDYNNKPCALVKIQVVDEVEKIEGYSIGKPVKKSGAEHWAYMCDGSKSMKIHFKNHLPIEIKFRDHQIESLESNKVYELVLQDPTGGRVTGSSPQTQKFILNYSPANATVIIDNKPYYGGNGRIEVELSVNDAHNYLITSEGYHHVQNSVTLSPSAPRIITETLVSTRPVGQNTTQQPVTPPGDTRDQEKRSIGGLIRNILPNDNYGGELRRKSDREKEVKPEKRKKEVKPEKRKKEVKLDSRDRSDGYYSSLGAENSGSQYHPVLETPDFSYSIQPPTGLNKTFEATYDGVIFKCKAKEGYVTITGFSTNADNVTIPATVQYKGKAYPVVEIDAYRNGCTYTTKTVVIQKGIKRISQYCFNEFRYLMELTIPNTVTYVGRRAVRGNKNLNIKAPSYIDVEWIKDGKSFEYSQKQ